MGHFLLCPKAQINTRIFLQTVPSQIIKTLHTLRLLLHIISQLKTIMIRPHLHHPHLPPPPRVLLRISQLELSLVPLFLPNPPFLARIGCHSRDGDELSFPRSADAGCFSCSAGL